jgi:peroxiredoxin
MFPHERSLVKRLEKSPFVLLGVNSDTKERITKAMKTEQITWPFFFDGGKTGGPIARQYGIKGWPTLFLIDSKGVIRQKWVGGPPAEVLDREIDKLLKEMGAEAPSAKAD